MNPNVRSRYIRQLRLALKRGDRLAVINLVNILWPGRPSALRALTA